MKAKKQQTNDSARKKPAIFLYDPAAIGIVVQRSKRERRSMSAALACIVLEWAGEKSAVQKARAAARRAKPLPESNQDTGGDEGFQQEKLADAGAIQDAAAGQGAADNGD